jgi:hypothetical protein
MKSIPLTRGFVTVVDDQNYEWLSQWSWCASSNRGQPYAIRGVNLGNGKHEGIKMHRVIINAPDGMEVDHISGDRLDNQRSNLRLCTVKQNRINRRRNNRGTSRYKGVTRVGKWWLAQIQHDYVKHHLGKYSSEQDAALAYNEAAKRLHGEFARLNEV